MAICNLSWQLADMGDTTCNFEFATCNCNLQRNLLAAAEDEAAEDEDMRIQTDILSPLEQGTKNRCQISSTITEFSA